jgi:hypothetical protein
VRKALPQPLLGYTKAMDYSTPDLKLPVWKAEIILGTSTVVKTRR